MIDVVRPYPEFAEPPPDRGGACKRAACRKTRARGVQTGDVVGFSQCGLWGWSINLCTLGLPGWGLSHVGICCDYDAYGRPLLWESTGLVHEPCIVSGITTYGVQAHPLRQRLANYRGRVWVYRLNEPLKPHERVILSEFLHANLGRSYDAPGAIAARHTLVARLRHRLLPTEDLSSLFCSELVAAALRCVERMPQEINPSAWSPNRLGRYLTRRRIARCVRWK